MYTKKDACKFQNIKESLSQSPMRIGQRIPICMADMVDVEFQEPNFNIYISN